jgi:hypothetical protein
MLSSGMWRCVDLGLTDVSEEEDNILQIKLSSDTKMAHSQRISQHLFLSEYHSLLTRSIFF